MIVIACSKVDLNNILSKNLNSDLIVIKAIPILQTID
jgi:hypothetical protein